MKNKTIFFALFAIAIVIIITLVIFNIMKKPCLPPERVNKVPSSAFWIGGCDGGLWYELVYQKDSIFNFRIYNDFDGRIITEGDFIISNNCYKQIIGAKIQDLISHSTNDKIYLLVKNNDKYCYLEKRTK